jgi:hypothetical protein
MEATPPENESVSNPPAVNVGSGAADDVATTIRNFVNFLHGGVSDGVVELAVMDVPNCGIISGYFDDLDALANISNCADAEGLGNFYATLNPVHPDLLARAENRILTSVPTRTSDADVVSVRQVLFDFDADREPGLCATDDEKAAARALFEAAVTVLDEACPGAAFALGDSGNGYYAILEIERETPGPETTSQIEKLLRLVETEARRRLPPPTPGAKTAHLDLTVTNPARLVRLLGTENRKVEDLPAGRRRRRSLLLSVRQGPSANLAGVIAHLEGSGMNAQGSSPTHPGNAAKSRPRISAFQGIGDEPKNVARVRTWLRGGAIDFREKAKTGAFRWIYELRDCPFHPPGTPDADGHEYECCITVGDDGKLGASCKHDAKRGWQAFKKKIGNWQAAGDGPQYYVKAGATWMIKEPEAGPMHVKLCNFTAHIVTDCSSDDGIEHARMFEIRGRVEDGGEFAGSILASDFASPTKAWARLSSIAGSSARIYPKQHDHVFDAVRALSDARRETLHSALGWIDIDGKKVFRTPTVAIGSEGTVPGIRVELGDLETLKHYGLPEDDAADVVGVVRDSLKLLGLGCPSIMYPLTSATLGAPVSSLLPPSPIHMVGGTGAYKTTTCEVMSSWFGVFKRKEDLVSWVSTAGAIAKAGYVAKDHLLVIDDFKNPRKEVWEQIFQNLGDRTGRARLRSDLSLRKTHVVRAAVISNGENLPSGEQSVLARLLIVRMTAGWITPQQLSEMQRLSIQLPYATRAYIKWLAANWGALERDLPTMCAPLRDAFALRLRDAHARIADNMAAVACGLVLYLGFAQEIGAVTPAETRAHHERLVDGLLAAGGETSAASRAERVSTTFLQAVDGMLLAGTIRLDDRRTPVSSPLAKVVPCVGWHDQAGIYLQPESSYTHVCENLRRAGVPLDVSKRAVHAQLFEDGYLARRDADGYTVPVRIGGQLMRVLHLRPGVLTGAAVAAVTGVTGSRGP